MLVLRSAPPSPFGRKVKITAALLGLSDRIRVENADTNDPDEALRAQNPLGKIPALILEDGETLYDSRVVVEYLDHLAGGGRLIPDGPERFPALTLQALADGVMDAGILQVYEIRWRAEDRREAKWTDYHVALAAALGYLDLRFEGRWRAEHPRLVAFLDDFERRVPAFAETRFTPPA